MKCAIVIGVNAVGDLTPLGAAVDGAQKFAAWAKSQGYEVKPHYDTDGPVYYHDVRASVKEIVKSRKYECLVIFFSGHGKWDGPGTETWLLSDAAEEPIEAITVFPSALAARDSGIPHVVFISDACRSVITDKRINHVTGGALFSGNTAHIDTKVDLIFSSRAGDPSYELRTPKEGTTAFGIFTECVLKGLHGQVPTILSPLTDNNNVQKNVIESEKLYEYLREAVPAEAFKRDPKLVQVPDSWIGSRLPKYLSEFPYTGNRQETNSNTRGIETGLPISKPDLLPHLNSPLLDDDNIEDRFMNRVFGKNTGFSASEYRRYKDATQLSASLLQEEPHILVYNSQKINASGRVTPHTPNEELSAALNTGGQIYPANWTPIPVSINTTMIRFATVSSGVYFLPLNNGMIIPLPVLNNFNTLVWMKADRVIHISFRPTPDNNRFNSYHIYQHSIEKRTLLLLKSAHAGNHHLFKVDNGEMLGSYLRRAKAFDPALGLYAVYAYAQAGQWEDILSVYRYMKEEAEGVLYDVQLFADLADRRRNSDKDQQIFNNSFPALTQGWAYLTEKQTERRPALTELRKYLVPGLWTRFTNEAIKIITALK